MPINAGEDNSVLYPDEWTVFGPVAASAVLAEGGMPHRSSLLPGEAFSSIPTQLAITDEIFPARKLSLKPGEIMDFDEFGGKMKRGETFYLLASVTVDEKTSLRMGAGTDWFMQWWLNGEPVFDTLDIGNCKAPIAVDNHVFILPLQKGENILAVAIIRGRSSFAFAAGNPELAASAPKISEFDRVMKSANAMITAKSYFVQGPIDYASVRILLENAMRVADTVEKKMQARMRLAEIRLHDFHDRDYVAIRELYREVEELAGQDTPDGWTPLRRRAIARGRAVLGIGRTYLAEGRAAEARAEFARVSDARFGSLGGVVPQEFICGMTAALMQDTAYQTARAYIQERRYNDAKHELQHLLEMNGISDQGGLGAQARKTIETLRQLPRLRQDRPRMFFNAETWPMVKQRALTTERVHFDSLQERIAGYSLDSENIFETWQGPAWKNLPETWGIHAMEAAFVYRVTGDPAILEKTRRMLRSTIDYFLTRKTMRCRSYSRIAFAAALDWVWNDLTPPERESLRAGLFEYVCTLLAEDELRGYAGRWTHYYERNVYRYAGMMLLDPELNDVDYARALEVLSRDSWLNIHEHDVKKHLESGFTGILTRSLVEYNVAETQNELWPVLHLWKSAIDKSIPPELVNVVSPEYVLRNALDFQSGMLHFGYARAWRRAGGVRTDLLFNHLAQMMFFFSDSNPEQSAIAGHLRVKMRAKGLTGSWTFPVFPFLMDIENTPTAGIPAGLSPARHFQVIGQVAMSSGFNENDTYALFSCGGNRCEGHYDATHFTIFKQGYLALDSGTRAQQLGSGASAMNYDGQTIAHNCVLIYMDGEDFPNPYQGHSLRPVDPIVNTGGQRRFPHAAQLLAFESNSNFVYVATDATPVYHEDKCKQMVRQFVFLLPDCFVIFDRVVSQQAEQHKTWVLHTANEPEVREITRMHNEWEFSAVQGRGKIFCRTLLPTDAVMGKIGGPGKEFWAGDRNWPIPANVPPGVLHGILDEDGNVSENIGRWRVEVKPGAARDQDIFLHLIQASDRDTETMVASELMEDDSRSGVKFKYDNREYLIMFNSAGDVGGYIEITEAGETLAARPFAQNVQESKMTQPK